MSEAINLYTNVIINAIPYGIAFSIGNMIVNAFMQAAFKGKMSI